MKRLVLLAALILSFALTTPAMVKATGNKSKSTATFTQQILPLDCIFVTIDTGLNTIRYITPEECGQVIIPGNTGGGSSSGSSGGGTYPANKPPSVGFIPSFTPPIASPQPSTAQPAQKPDKSLLNSHGEASTARGYDMVVHPGSVLSYLPSNRPNKQVHHLTVTSMNDKGVTLLLEPGRKPQTVAPDQTILADTDDRGVAAIAIKLLGKPDNQTARLRIWLLDNNLTVKEILQSHDSEVHSKFIPASILVILVTFLFNLNYYHRRKSSK